MKKLILQSLRFKRFVLLFSSFLVSSAVTLAQVDIAAGTNFNLCGKASSGIYSIRPTNADFVTGTGEIVTDIVSTSNTGAAIDFDADGYNEIVLRTVGNNATSQIQTRIYIFEASANNNYQRVALQLIDNGTNGSTPGLSKGLDIGNIDGDAAFEIVAFSGVSTSTFLTAYDVNNTFAFTELAQSRLYGFTGSTDGIITNGNNPGTVNTVKIVPNKNGNSNNDILISNATGSVTHLAALEFDNTSAFTFLSSGAMAGYNGGVYAFNVADIDNDGNLEVIMLCETVTNSLRIREYVTAAISSECFGTSDLPVTGNWNATTSGRAYTTVAVADIDGDGDLEAVCPNYNGRNINVVTWDGANYNASMVINLSSAAQTPISVAVADLDRDGFKEILYTTSHGTNAGSVTLREHDGTANTFAALNFANFLSVASGVGSASANFMSVIAVNELTSTSDKDNNFEVFLGRASNNTDTDLDGDEFFVLEINRIFGGGTGISGYGATPTAIPNGEYDGLTNSLGTSTLGTSVNINGNLHLNSPSILSIGSSTLNLFGTTSGAGFIRGGNTSNLLINGNGSFGALNFDQTTDGTTNVIQNLTLNRTSNGTASFGNKVLFTGSLTLTDGTLSATNVGLSGIAAQTVSFGSSTSKFNVDTLSLSNSAGAQLVGTGICNVSNILNITSGNLNTGGILTLKSTELNTAQVSSLLGSISGNVTVERFLPARRAWRFLTAPVTQATPSSLNATWQDSIDIVGPSGSNLSATTVGYNFQTFDAATNVWVNVSNPAAVNLTGSSLNSAFATFIAGRKTTAFGDSTNVTLVSTGELLTGTKTFTVTAPTDNYALIPNPYASPVDLNAVYGASTGIYRTFYTWDPRQGGSIGTGGYITMSWNGVSYDILGNGNATAQDLNVQSGQAFFVQASAPNPSIVFDEAHKSTTNINTVFGVGTGNVDNLRIGVQRIESGSPVLVGEVLTSYHNNYSKAVNFNDDAEKMWNNEENIAIRREGYNLSIERRPFIGGSNDSIFLGLSSLRANTNYSLSFSPSNWDAGSKAYLIDKLLSTETLIDLNSTNFVHQFTSTVATANDRFVVVFRGATLPNRGFTLGAEKLGTNKVKVNWEAQGEVGVREYALERSVDGVSYQVINTQQAKNNNTVSNYTYTDNSPMNGVNYYRVKTTQQNDVERYSSIVTINFKQQSSNPVTVYPNPVKGNQIGLQLQEIDKGLYSVRILSIEGKEVYKQQLQVSGTSLNTTISPTSKLASGTYTLQVVGKNNSYTQKIVVE